MGSGNTLELAALLRRSKAFLMGRVVTLEAFSKMSQITSVFNIKQESEAQGPRLVGTFHLICNPTEIYAHIHLSE